ncbi:MAG TPA: hypothetical protein VII97_13155 [Anaerolineales bacterium]
MQPRFRAVWTAAILLFVFAAVSAFVTWRVSAAGEQPPGPDRFAVITQDYTSYEWWLTGWADNKVTCSIMVDHEGAPTGGEIYAVCGATLYNKWLATKPCETAEENPTACQGYYLVFFKSEPAQREVDVKQAPPVVWVTLDGCVPINSTFRCDGLPTLVLTGEEPMEGEHITGLAGRMDGKAFTCDPVCQVDLAPTNENGLYLEFWATSSYGDSSELFDAQVRVTAPDDPTDPSWYVDVLSIEWRGPPLAACSQTWKTFPPVGGVPAWLSTSPSAKDLATHIPYEYLAANLIQQGVADTSTCTDSGLLENGLASPCGLETARSAVNDWQNRFDGLIFNAAQETGIPARLLKNIFSRESQFWPGMTIGYPEAGLGQMTNSGADTTLLWNRPFYEQFCPSVLDGAICGRGYAHLNSEQKDTLRNALVSSVNALCPDCALGIDLDRAGNSVGIFAETLLANCEQTGMVVDLNNITNTPVAYEDLWRFTLVNYNAGPGCLGLAVSETSRSGEPLDWEHVSSHLTPVCQGAFDYVTDISNVSP